MQEFDGSKLISSLLRSGAERGVAEHILAEVEKTLYGGITTNEIYRRAFAHLRKHRHGIAARYSLKRAILDFGPSGFPFEAYIAEVFRTEGFVVEIDQMVKGACVEHEVDAVLKRGEETIYVEAKFHNVAGFKTDLKTVLYVKARLNDIAATGESANNKMRGMVVTNTKFTSHALRYARCQELELLGWEYPSGKTLQDRIERAGVYPITALTTLNRREKVALLGERRVLCNDLRADAEMLERIGVPGRRAEAVLDEAGTLCVPGKAV
jgi:hypothetical protein